MQLLLRNSVRKLVKGRSCLEAATNRMLTKRPVPLTNVLQLAIKQPHSQLLQRQYYCRHLQQPQTGTLWFLTSNLG
jgi:hypothetical protein